MAVIAHRTCLVLLAVGMVGIACGGPDDDPSRGRSAGRVLVFTTTWPLFDLVERLADGAVDVFCAVPLGRDLRGWQPSREELATLAAADLLLLNGAGLERWAERANLPRASTVDTSRAIADRLIEVESEVSHSHGTGEVHTHSGQDPHVWLDPELYAVQARAVAEALMIRVPEQREAIEGRLEVLLGELASLAAELRSLPPLAANQVLVASHPTWAYLAQRADLPLLDVDLDPGNSDAGAVADRLVEALGPRRAIAVLWEQVPGAEIRDAVLEATGARSVVFDPQVVRDANDMLGRHSVEAPSIQTLREGLRALTAALIAR